MPALSMIWGVCARPRVSKQAAKIGNFEGIFESCVTNFDKISSFSLRSRYGKFRVFHPSSEFVVRQGRSVSDLQRTPCREPHTPTPLPGTTHAARQRPAGAAHRGTRLSAAHTMTMSLTLFYEHRASLGEGVRATRGARSRAPEMQRIATCNTVDPSRV